MNILTELSIILVSAAVLSGLMKFLKQPIITGYILTGILLGPQVLGVFKGTNTLSAYSEIGVAILLFIVGLHLSPKEVKDLGKPALIIGTLQIALTIICGYLISLVFGFSKVEAIYLGIALSFSSTIIVLKLLSDKHDLEKLYGRISIGVLLLQDVVATVVLIFAATASQNYSGVATFLLLAFKALILILSISMVSLYVLPYLSEQFAKSQEFLFIFAIAWGFGIASLFSVIGLSAEIGALIAGVALSISPYSREISSRLKPLRDFFIVMFFIFLGTLIYPSHLVKLLPAILVFSLVATIIKPLIVVVISQFLRYNKKTAFMTGTSLAQISEFSMILALLGYEMNHISERVMELITITGVITIFVSTYLIMYSEKIYTKLARYLELFSGRKIKKEVSIVTNYDVILFGCNRVGYDFIKVFKDLGSGFLTVDFDPEIIKEVKKGGINCIYGDAEDSEFLDDIEASKAKLIVSTIPEFETNMFVTSKIRSQNQSSILIVISYKIEDAIKLYEQGASYVILPHFISGEFAANLAKDAGFDVSKFHSKREHHINYLKERKAMGHSHPVWNHY